MLGTDIATYLATLQPLVADPVANRAAIVAGIDGFLDGAFALLERAQRFNMDRAGQGFARDWKFTAFTDLLAQVTTLVGRWNQRLTDYDSQMSAYDLLPAATSTMPAFSSYERPRFLSQRAGTAAAQPRRCGWRSTLTAPRSSPAAASSRRSSPRPLDLSPRYLLPTQAIATSDLDPQPFDLTGFEDRALLLAEDLAATSLASRRPS